jgi:hypothetical protein
MRNLLYMTIIQHRVVIFVPQLSTCCHMHSLVRITGVRYVPRVLCFVPKFESRHTLFPFS